MHSKIFRTIGTLVTTLACTLAAPAFAANIAVISNSYFDETAADFSGRYTDHTFTGVDGTDPLSLGDLAAYDAVLLFEDGLFANAPNIGDVVAEFANTGRAVVIGTFYNQDRSDNIEFTPNGWGDLEDLDPNVTDGIGTSYDGDVLDTTSIVPHPLTDGVLDVYSDSGTGYSGGNQAKPGSVVLALWSNDNDLGNPDPAIAYRITGSACVTHIGIIPHYNVIDQFGVDFGGEDYFQLWGNAMDWAASGCQGAPETVPVPATGNWALAVLILSLMLVGGQAAIRRI